MYSEDNTPPLLPTLLGPLTEILKSTTQDPTALLSLTIKLLSPLSFTRLLTVADSPTILAALRSPLPGANLLGLAIIHKAARTPADAAILSTLPEVTEELVRRWLEVADVGVGEKSARVLGDLLETDCQVVEPNGAPVNGVNGNELVGRQVPGHGRLWSMILDTEEFLSIIVDLCSPSDDRTERQVSLSQGRLLRLLPRLATLNIHAITRSSFSNILPVSPSTAQGGLLQWASFTMVDKSDMLMHLSLIDFFETLVSVMRISATAVKDKDDILKSLVQTATQNDAQLKEALVSLPDRTIEEEAEPLRLYIGKLLH